MRDPLVLPFFAFAAGIVAARVGGVTPDQARWALAGFLVLALAGALRGRKWLPRVCIGLSLACAGAWDTAWQSPRQPDPAPLRAGETQPIEGCLLENGVYRDGLLRLKVEVQPGASVSIAVAVGRGETLPARPLAGTRVALEAKVRAPHSYRNPGSFDYGEYLARQGIFWTGSAKAASYRTLAGRCGPPWRYWLGRVRQDGLDALDRLYAKDDYARGMMRGLLLGDASGIRDVWTQDWRRTGTYHALVISGSQITFVTMLFLLWLRVARAGERPLLVSAAVAGWIYALLCGGSAPVLRAAAGFALFVCARFLYRRPRLVNLLAAVALAFVAVSPDELFDASFQLTFLSVGALGAIAEPLSKHWFGDWRAALRALSRSQNVPAIEPRVAALRTELLLLAETAALTLRCPVRHAAVAMRIVGWIVLYALELMLLSACVQWALSIPMILYFHRLSITGLTANILIVPAVSLAIPFGFAGAATGWRFLADTGLFFLKFAQAAATLHARYEPKWRVPDPPLAALLLFFVLLAVFCAALRRQSRWAAPAALASLVVLGVIAWHPFPASLQPGTLEVAMIDVGQGDSVLLGLPSGGAALVDTGGIQTFGPRRQRDSGFDTGEDVVSPYLWRRGLKRLDVLMISHAHADHAGGAAAILENFHPKEVWGAFDVGTADWTRLEAQARAAGCVVRTLHRGEVFDQGGLHWEVLGPLPAASAHDINEASLVMRASFGRHSLLLTGDIDRRTEALLLEAGYAERADILKVAHHGSRNSSLPRFLDVLKPSLAMVSAGFENNFGHPNAVTLRSLAERHALLLRTDLQGLVVARSDSRHLEVEGHPQGFELPPAWEGY